MKSKVTFEYLDIACRMCNIELHKDILIKIVDIVTLIQAKGGKADIKDIAKLKADWSKIN